MSEKVQVTVEEALEIGIGHHKSGNLDEAESVYRLILTGAPRHVPALHMLAIVLHQRGEHQQALDMMERALASDPLNPALYNNCGEICRAQGRLGEAITRYETALRLKPDYAEAFNNLGVALAQAGRWQESRECLEKALSLAPDYAEAHKNLALQYERDGDDEQAMVHLERAVRLQPRDADALEHLGVLLERGEGRLQHALARYQTEFEEAVQSLEAAIEQHVGDAVAHDRLGLALQYLGRLDEAVAQHEEAIRLDPELPQAYNNLGNALQRQGRYEESIPRYEQALQLHEANPYAHSNLGAALHFRGRLDEAVNHLQRALEIKPGFISAQYNLGLINLARGAFTTAWKDYLLRNGEYGKPSVEGPLPDDLSGRRLMVVEDQGLGDELFFLRFARNLKQRGAWIAYRPQEKLSLLAMRMPFVDQVVMMGDETPERLDWVLPAGDLPYASGMKEALQAPASIEIPVKPGMVQLARERLAEAGPGPYLGITWRAGQPLGRAVPYSKRLALTKEIPPAELAAAVCHWPGTVVILQRQPEAEEIAAFNSGLGRDALDLSAWNESLEQMLALLSVLDDYVAVSNTNVHLREAVGRNSRVLIPMNTVDWRWMAEGDRSLWFPDCVLYRQTNSGDWRTALARLQAELHL